MKSITPKQETGKAINASSSREFPSRAEAETFFVTLRNRLQDINNWHRLTSGLSAEFRLADPAGEPVNRALRKGDLLKIDIPGPGSGSGDGYDWVMVEDIESNGTHDRENYSFRVRPAENPQTSGDDIAHFYSPESTSTFIVGRIDNKVFAEIHDRNIKPNSEVEKPIDQVRDAVVGTVGMLSLSKIQWQNLTDGLIGV
jgi:hypothetical protein